MHEISETGSDVGVAAHYNPGDPAPDFPASHREDMTMAAVGERRHHRVHVRQIRWPDQHPGGTHRITF